MLIKCSFCGNEVDISNKKVNRNNLKGHNTYCSPECFRLSKITGKHSFCANCNKPIFIKNSRLLRGKSGNFFCGRSCSTSFNNAFYKAGENHPNWTDGTASYRGKALRNLPKYCKVCGYSDERVLVVHHLDKDRGNADISNLVILCPTHHIEVHLGITKLNL